jgi:hypothetical protein
MEKLVNNKTFWTALSFLTFAIFVIAISTKIYWLNVFVIPLGLLIRNYGSTALFKKGEEKRKAIKNELITAGVIRKPRKTAK